MEIETFVTLAVVAIVAAIVGFWAAWRLGASRASEGTAVTENVLAVGVNHCPSSVDTSETSHSGQIPPVGDPTVAGDLVVLDNNGEVLLSCREIDHPLPSCETDAGKNGAALDCANQLVTELITRSMTLPGKTVEIIFDPSIQKGLSSGAYEVVNVASGEGHRLMARVIDSKKFVGQGRFMAAGKLKQVGISGFHIVSIAVAQAHLVEINKNLEGIKEGVEGLRDFLEAKDIAQLRGTVEYLKYVVDFIRRMDSPDRLPIEKRNELEGIRREIMTWFAQIEEEAGRFCKKIERQGDEDTFGTGKTFKKLKEHANAVGQLINKYSSFLHMASLFNMISAYLDPMGFLDPNVNRFSHPSATTTAILRAVHQLEKRADKLLCNAEWNRDKTLKQRQQDLKQEVRSLEETLEEKMEIFADCMGRLEGQLSKIGDPQGHVRMAITFNSAGRESAKVSWNLKRLPLLW